MSSPDTEHLKPTAYSGARSSAATQPVAPLWSRTLRQARPSDWVSPPITSTTAPSGNVRRIGAVVDAPEAITWLLERGWRVTAVDMPLFGLNWVHGAAAKLAWNPRIDGMVLFSEMSLEA